MIKGGGFWEIDSIVVLLVNRSSLWYASLGRDSLDERLDASQCGTFFNNLEVT
jgi:hypothetical protein